MIYLSFNISILCYDKNKNTHKHYKWNIYTRSLFSVPLVMFVVILIYFKCTVHILLYGCMDLCAFKCCRNSYKTFFPTRLIPMNAHSSWNNNN